jgi:hypothetical protein
LKNNPSISSKPDAFRYLTRVALYEENIRNWTPDSQKKANESRICRLSFADLLIGGYYRNLTDLTLYCKKVPQGIWSWIAGAKSLRRLSRLITENYVEISDDEFIWAWTEGAEFCRAVLGNPNIEELRLLGECGSFNKAETLDMMCSLASGGSWTRLAMLLNEYAQPVNISHDLGKAIASNPRLLHLEISSLNDIMLAPYLQHNTTLRSLKISGSSELSQKLPEGSKFALKRLEVCSNYYSLYFPRDVTNWLAGVQHLHLPLNGGREMDGLIRCDGSLVESTLMQTFLKEMQKICRNPTLETITINIKNHRPSAWFAILIDIFERYLPAETCIRTITLVETELYSNTGEVSRVDEIYRRNLIGTILIAIRNLPEQVQLRLQIFGKEYYARQLRGRMLAEGVSQNRVSITNVQADHDMYRLRNSFPREVARYIQ